MNDAEVIDAVRDLVERGEYCDEIPGVPGARLTGGGVFRDDRRLYSRGSEEYLEARAAGLTERLPPLPLASRAAIEEAELAVGSPLPELLRRLYLEVGNGAFGPAYGVLGVAGGHRDDCQRTAIEPEQELSSALFPEDIALVDWLGRWIELRLNQPAAVQDPVSGKWRGATEAEHRMWASEMAQD